jgi:hypothetical protein
MDDSKTAIPVFPEQGTFVRGTPAILTIDFSINYAITFFPDAISPLVSKSLKNI